MITFKKLNKLKNQTLIAPVLGRSLKSFISFNVILDTALVTFSVSCFSWNVSAHRTDGIGSFLGFSVIVLAVLLYYCHSHSQLNHSILSLTTSSTCKLLKQYIIIRQLIFLPVLIHSLSILNIWSFLCL